ncbi:MAG: ATP-dependent RecD-like DNA helicase, partial [Deltaproteobacteria bacterium]|nr:ATP-dependent RecD-like DNA helicase [Deltaproteobacteria bacterium]
QFGDKTLDVIEAQPKKLLTVDGIGEKRLKMIRKAWEDHREICDVMVFLQGHGVITGYSAKIFKQYGSRAIQVVRQNPYQLTADVFGIGFVIADNIAEKVGVPRDSLMRAEAGIEHVLGKMCENGHCYVIYEDLMAQARDLLGIGSDILKKAFDNLCAEGKIVVENINGAAPDRESKTCVYLKAFHAAEKGLAHRLKALLSVPFKSALPHRDKLLKLVHKRLAIALSDEQQQALETVLSSKISIVTGGPGTGKTTLVRAMLAVFEATGKHILLAAPTGRAAKRLSEVTGREAKTIHRLLAFNFRSGGFQKNEDNPLDADVVIVDEASMVDVFLMYHLVKALPASAVLVLVGDINQLPPVGPGNVLRDMLESSRVPAVYLTEIFRQARESLIVINAHQINEGYFPSIPPANDHGLQDFYFIEQGDPDKVIATIQELCAVRIPRRFNLNPMTDIQVLTPMHKGVVGTANLNRVLQETLNPSGHIVERMGRAFRQGDKVMQIRNNYAKEVFNGDIGIIVRIDAESGELSVNYDGMIVDYDFTELDELVLAYAVSVHKSQGCEYEAVVFPVMTQHFVLLQRNLIYTGITRAKRLVVLIGTKKALAIAIKNDRPQQRMTRLADRLQ